MWVGPEERKTDFIFGKDLDHILDKKSRMVKDPSFDVFSMTLAFWLTLRQNY